MEMNAGNSRSGCRGFAIVCPGRERSAPDAAFGIAEWLVQKGINTLVIESHVRDASRERAIRTLDEARPHLGSLDAAALRGYLAYGSMRMGRLALSERAPTDAQLRLLSSAYGIVLFRADTAVFDQGAAAISLEALAALPALVVASAIADGSVTAAGRAIESMLSAEVSLRPVAFCISPFDSAVAARLARRWRLASWGDASDFARLAGRVLDRAVEISCNVDACECSTPAVRAAQRARDSTARAARIVLQRIREDRELGGVMKAAVSRVDGTREGRDRIISEARRLTAALEREELGGAGRDEVIARVIDDALGFGPLTGLLADPEVTEVMACGSEKIYVERGGRIARADLSFADDAHLMAVIERLLITTGRRLDEASPAVDARLPDGSRLHAIIPPLAVDGPALTIRRFLKSIEGMAQAVEMGMLHKEAADFLRACIRARLSIVISGGTGAGKTTLLGALASEIDPAERIVTIEDAAELKIRLPHVVRLEARPPNIEGAGAVTIRDLVRNALRMRPDRIVVGECRGAEALDMLQAMNTGHEGSLTTVHANSPRDALARIETMVLMAGAELPLAAVREQIVRAVDFIVQVARVRGGARRVVEIAEVTGMEGAVVSMQTLAASEDCGGILVPTGLPPRSAERLRASGIELPTLQP